MSLVGAALLLSLGRQEFAAFWLEGPWTAPPTGGSGLYLKVRGGKEEDAILSISNFLKFRLSAPRHDCSV